MDEVRLSKGTMPKAIWWTHPAANPVKRALGMKDTGIPYSITRDGNFDAPIKDALTRASTDPLLGLQEERLQAFLRNRQPATLGPHWTQTASGAVEATQGGVTQRIEVDDKKSQVTMKATLATPIQGASEQWLIGRFDATGTVSRDSVEEVLRGQGIDDQLYSGGSMPGILDVFPFLSEFGLRR